MAFSTGWLLDKLGQKIYAWSTTNAVMDFDRGGGTGQTLQKTLDDLESSKGDMRKDVFATNGKPGVVDNAVNGINTYIHSKQGAVHNFQGEGSNGKALMTANFEEGDSITVNGAPVTAYMGTDEAVASMAGNEWNGKWITFTFEGNTLNFKGGGGGKVTVSGLSAEKILNDTTITITQGSKVINSVKGSITQQSQKIVTPNTQNQQFGPGIYLSGPLVVSGDPSLIASNIRKGATIFGVAGTANYSGSCVAPTIMAHCALGQYASNNGFLSFFPLGFISDGSFRISGTQLICDVAGTYNIQCSVQKKNSWTFAYGVDLRLNGSNIDTDPIASSFRRTLNKGDYFQFYYHVSTDENGTNAAAVACLKIDRVG